MLACVPVCMWLFVVWIYAYSKFHKVPLLHAARPLDAASNAHVANRVHGNNGCEIVYLGDSGWAMGWVVRLCARACVRACVRVYCGYVSCWSCIHVLDESNASCTCNIYIYILQCSWNIHTLHMHVLKRLYLYVHILKVLCMYMFWRRRTQSLRLFQRLSFG